MHPPRVGAPVRGLRERRALARLLAHGRDAGLAARVRFRTSVPHGLLRGALRSRQSVLRHGAHPVVARDFAPVTRGGARFSEGGLTRRCSERLPAA